MTATRAVLGTAHGTRRSAEPLTYQSGFGNECATEALPGALPVGQNSPQRVPYGLYAEQLSGTAFTAARGANRRSWTYRIRPAAVHHPFRQIDGGRIVSGFGDVVTPPNQLRWDPLPAPAVPTDFVEGIVTMAGNGDPAAMSGCAIHLYAANRSMSGRFFNNADGEMLIVPQDGRLLLATEFGRVEVEPQEIAVVPIRHATEAANVTCLLITSSPAPACVTSARSGIKIRPARVCRSWCCFQSGHAHASNWPH